MKLLKAKLIIPFAILVVMLVLSIGYCMLYDKKNHYYLVSYTKRVEKGLPVLIENIDAGKVTNVVAGATQNEPWIIRIELTREFSIPANSMIELIRTKEGEFKEIRINVLASRNYLQSGDTMYLDDGINGTEIHEDKRTKKQIDSEGHLDFAVQLFVSESELPLDSPVFLGIQDVWYKEQGGVYKYYTSTVETLEEAVELRKFIYNRGIKDAFIVPFLNGERISIQQSRMYEK